MQKLQRLCVSLLAGAKAVSHTGTTRRADRADRADRALQAALGLPGCAEQSVIADTLDAATAQAVADLRRAVEEVFVRSSQARRRAVAPAILTLDRDLSPAPASAKAEGSERAFMGRSRSQTGRKLVRVRAAPYQEIVWEDVRPGRTAEGLPVLEEAVLAAERLLGLDGDNAEVVAKRARTDEAGLPRDRHVQGLAARAEAGPADPGLAGDQQCGPGGRRHPAADRAAGLVLGGRPGAVFSGRLGMPAGRSTLLRLLKALPLPEMPRTKSPSGP